VLTSHIVLLLAWVLFGFLHSALATTRVKETFAATPIGRHYRIWYNLFAFVTFFAIILFQWKMRSPFLFAPVPIVGGIFAVSGLLLMAVCIRKYFLRLSGIKLLLTGGRSDNKLRIDGVHNYVRHPLYLGTFIFIWGLFLLIPQLSLLISDAVITIYTIIGTTYEERKLVKEFGDDYRAYQQRVPKFFPKESDQW
jgi:methanethiol S-methyltransferase